jgi:thiamine transport system substrate-binding protein
MAHSRTSRTRTGATRLTAGALAAAATAAALAACSVVGESGGSPAAGDGEGGGGEVVLVTHDSFALPEDLVAAFEADTGYTLTTRAPGDGGAMVNQLVLTKDAPLGDVVYGIDNTFASRAVDEGVLEPYTPDGAVDEYAIEGLTAIDMSDVCINVDHEWFADAGIPEPVTLEDLTDPTYRDLLVVTNPTTSSPGLAFMLATIGAFGEDGWLDYWVALRDNGVKIVAGWSDAYYVDFSGSSGQGDRPLVLSYASSPPYEVPDGADTAPTGALLETCFRQVEYAGVLAGAKNPDGARAVVDWLLSPEVQAAIPESMYVYPVTDVDLPESWQAFAPLAPAPFHVEPEDISANRDAWLERWTDAVVG